VFEACFAVVAPGLLTTVQDLGRPNAAALGVPRSGACDALALRAGNLLVGNPDGAAALEFSLLGPELRVLRPCLVAPTGADFEATIVDTGERLRPGRSVSLRAGSTLRFGAAADGARGYLAVRGGIGVPLVLGSASTVLAAGFGGLSGRALLTDDIIAVVVTAESASVPAGLRSWPGPGPSSGVAGVAGVSGGPDDPVALRVVRGPHADLLGPAAWDWLVGTVWSVDAQSDRMGVRLTTASSEDQPAATPQVPALVSLPMIWGAVQLPPGGAPICLLADGPTVGGYPVIAAIASADLPALGQLRPADRVQFRPVELHEAQAAWIRAETALREAARRLGIAHEPSSSGATPHG
jgi:antagonist of KipI